MAALKQSVRCGADPWFRWGREGGRVVSLDTRADNVIAANNVLQLLWAISPGNASLYLGIVVGRTRAWLFKHPIIMAWHCRGALSSQGRCHPLHAKNNIAGRIVPL